MENREIDWHLCLGDPYDFGKECYPYVTPEMLYKAFVKRFLVELGDSMAANEGRLPDAFESMYMEHCK